MPTTKSSGSKILPGIVVNRAIVAIHNAIDEIERKKKKRKALGDEIAAIKKKLAGNMRRNRKKMVKVGKHGLAYRFAGYVAVLSENEKIETKIGQES